MRDVNTYKVFKIINSASIWLTALLLSGCWSFGVPRGDTPEDFTNGKRAIKSLLGATNEEVVDALGQPTWITLKDENIYYIYQWMSREAGIIMIGYIPVPWVFRDSDDDQADQAHCILLEFDGDGLLKSYKVDTKGYGVAIMGGGPLQSPGNCLRVFGMQGSGSRLLYKYSGLSPEDMKKETAWRLDREVKTYCPNADAGDANAQKYIGDFYRFGFFSLKKDLIRAYVWYSLAVKSANKEASEQLGYLVKELSPQQLIEARTQLDEWEPGQCKRDLMEAISGENE